MGKLKSLSGVLILGAIIIHLMLTPMLFTSILSYVNNSYKKQFIENVRGSTNILANQFNQFSFISDRSNIESFLDEILLGGQITYAEVVLSDDEIYQPREIPLDATVYQEDFYFDQHDDHIYFISAPIVSSYTGAKGFLRLGFDESFIIEQIETTFERGAYIAAGYFFLTLFAILFLVPKSTAPLGKLRDTAKKSHPVITVKIFK